MRWGGGCGGGGGGWGSAPTPVSMRLLSKHPPLFFEMAQASGGVGCSNAGEKEKKLKLAGVHWSPVTCVGAEDSVWVEEQQRSL